MQSFATARKGDAPGKRQRPSTAHPSGQSWRGQVPTVHHILHAPRLQPKLTLGAPNDAYEQEADRIADRVMRLSDAEVQATPASPALQRLCSDCEEELRTKREGGGTNPAAPVPPIVYEVLRSPGRPLDAETRAFFEPRFGHDFGAVRIHTDTQAAASAEAVNALAYTLGPSIVFGRGQYRPETYDGRRLLAHELTHSRQQGGGNGESSLRRTDFGLLGGRCCNESGGDEWALAGEGEWQPLPPGGECTGLLDDCDGITCGGGFYHTGGAAGTKLLLSSVCRTPRQDSAYFRDRRWTPTNPSLPPDAMSPTERGSQQGDVPPGYVYDAT